MHSSRVIVTGASGHIGFHVAKLLTEQQHEVILLSRRENINILKLKRLGAQNHICNLSEPLTYNHLLQEVSCVFHLAAENTTSKSNAERVITNTAGIAEIFLQACLDANIPTIVYTSSVVVLGRSPNKRKLVTLNDRVEHPESPYVDGKVKAEQLVQKFIDEKKADIRRIYPSWVIGPDDAGQTPPHKIIMDFVAKGQKFWFAGGISIAHVEEVAKAHIDAWKKGEMAGRYIAGGSNITFKEFYRLLAKYSGQGSPFIKIPKFVIVTGAAVTAPLFRMMGMEPRLDVSYAKSVFGNYSWYDSRETVKKLGYKIHPAEEMLKEAVEDARRKLVKVQQLGFERLESRPNDDGKGTLLVTGVPGWLGNRLVNIMINGDRDGEFRTGRPVRLLVEKKFEGYLNLPPNFEIIYGDLSDKEALKKAVNGVSAVFHIAGAIYPKKIKTLYKVNTEGTKNLVDACIEAGVRRIIYMSTDSVCGHGTKKQRKFDENTVARPYKNYGKSKYLAEKYILDKTQQGLIDGTSLRGFWFFGPFAPERQLSFFRMFDLPRIPVFGNGKNLRSISHVDNIVQAFFKCENNPATFGKWYWICGNESELSVDHINSIVAAKLGKAYKPLYIPVWICRMFGLLDTFLGLFGILHPSIHAAGKFFFDIAGSADAAKRDFGYEPKVSFDDAAEELREMLGN